ncbi:DUF3048 domain-containing protein [Ferrimicrobium acidiphilum]|uniref:Putative lipoprotein YerB n=1 Tax=Ferrimicrobium acidiphilum DSM 19497 TaxID=1121877 RepID=A0A0D8FX20_9ACTN|nr:DUF3048 domain-containing protein [Ferrimicrobium acidiphilum]KJE76812.1 putative lipoprotein YerB precursor [Ferrimicrobium acidiphilum DSM 19497]MCL5052281.1 DUF3048 domain-containing protein [Gammaproteobacteria bacterium]
MAQHARAKRGKVQRSRRSRRGKIIGILVVVVILAVAVTIGSLQSSHQVVTPTKTSHTSAPKTSKSVPPTVPASTQARCPLTDLPAPNGQVPQRPALAIKVGNDPGARPQSGLSAADVVYEVQAEGGITRFIAVFQCQTPATVGPIRSLRWVDWHVVHQLGHPILVSAGGINPDIYAVKAQSWLHYIDALAFTGAPFERISSRVPPENLYGSPSEIWSLVSSKTPPPRLFDFSSTLPKGGTSVGTVYLPFSSPEDVSWEWSASANRFLRFYSGQPANGNGGEQLSATNVVIQFVNAPPGKYNESGPHSLGVHSQTVGTGPAWILRNGEIFKGSWQRSSLSQTTSYHLSDGEQISLAPGQTWVEVVPNWVHATETAPS